MEAVADETVNTQELAAESAALNSEQKSDASAAAEGSEQPVENSAKEEKPADSAGAGDMPLPDGFEMPDLSDLDEMMKEAGL